MKRFLLILLAMSMLLSMISCASQITVTGGEDQATSGETFSQTQPDQEDSAAKTEEEAPKTEEVSKEEIPQVNGFSAGYASVVVNPKTGVCLGGWATAGKRVSETVVDDIEITCTALSDGKNTFLLYTLDALYVRDTMLDQVTKMMEETYGIPPENVVMNASHSHSAPILHYPNMTGMPQYMKLFYPALKDATSKAIQSLSEAEVFVGTANAETFNYVRRYVYLDGSGYAGGTSMAEKEPTEVRHETKADSEMQIIRFQRKKGKDIILCNWQCHPCSAGIGTEKGTKVSSDWVGILRQTATEKLDVHFAYFQGAAGNLAGSSRIKGEKDNKDYKKKGKELVAFVEEAIQNAVKAEVGELKAKRITYVGTHNDSYKAKEPSMGGKEEMYLNVLSFGDVAIATAPCELHDTLGMYVKDNSPYKMTFMSAYSNGVVSYVPSQAAYDNGGYEANMFHFVRGTGEIMVQKLVEMLREQYNG